MIDLSTTYMGLTLNSPIVVSSNPLCDSIEQIQRMEAAGAGAVILPSLFEEQLTIADMDLDYYLEHDRDALPDRLRFAPDMKSHNKGADGYFAHLYRSRRATNIPIIASLNGSSDGGWVRYAQMLEGAGASALELNIYQLPARLHETGTEVEHAYLNLVKDVKLRVTIPVAVKLSPYFSSLPHMVHGLAEAGADAVVLFNRFYQPDIDLETETVTPNLQLSNSAELRLRLRWVAILHDHVKSELAITGGVHSGDDLIKSILAGARVAMMASALLKHGPGHIATVLREATAWMDAHGYSTIDAVRGRLSQRHVADTSAFERANYLQVLSSFEQGDA
jgi:dihydroorotate dehydrogenase (fumarate)